MCLWHAHTVALKPGGEKEKDQPGESLFLFFFLLVLSLPFRSLSKIAINKIMRSYVRCGLESCTVLRARPNVLSLSLSLLRSMFRNRSVIEQHD